jgi:hypothetical protein
VLTAPSLCSALVMVRWQAQGAIINLLWWTCIALGDCQGCLIICSWQFSETADHTLHVQHF